MVKMTRKVLTVFIASALAVCAAGLLVSADGANPVSNPDFEILNASNLPEGWSLLGGVPAECFGTGTGSGGEGNSLKLANDNASQTYTHVYQDVAVSWAAGTIGEISFDVNAVSGKPEVLVYMYDSLETQYSATKTYDSTKLISGFGKRGFKFRAPQDKEITRLRVYLRLSGVGEIYYDNIKLSTTTNLVTNGDFEYITPDTWDNYTGGAGNVLDQKWEGSVAFVTTESNGNHALKFNSSAGTNNVRMTFDTSLRSYMAGKNYKVSFNFKWDKSHPTFAATTESPVLTMRYASGNDVYNRVLLTAAPENVWTTYVMYISIPAGKDLQGFTFGAWAANMSIYYDDVTMTEEPASELFFAKQNITVGTYSTSQQTSYSTGSGLASNLNADIYVPLTEVSNGPAIIRYKHISATAGTDKATVFAGLFRNSGGVRTLISLSEVKNYTGSAGEPLTKGEANMTISLPPAEDGVMYTLEAFAWSGVNEITPLIAKEVF